MITEQDGKWLTGTWLTFAGPYIELAEQSGNFSIAGCFGPGTLIHAQLCFSECGMGEKHTPFQHTHTHIKTCHHSSCSERRSVYLAKQMSVRLL